MEIDSIQTDSLQVGNQTINDLSNYVTDNLIMNGDFLLVDYGTLVDNPTDAEEYNCVNRWRIRRANNAGNCRFGRSSVDSPNGGACLYMRRNSGDTNTNQFVIQQQVEANYIYGVRGRKITLSFQLYAEQEWLDDWASSDVKIATGTTLNESITIGDTATGEVVLYEGTFAAPTTAETWQKYTFTTDVVVPSNALCLYVKIKFGVSGTASADVINRIGEVKLEPGETATPWLGRPISIEQALCARYYQLSDTSTNGQPMWSGDITTGNDYYISIPFPYAMRSAPTVTVTYGSDAGFNEATLAAQTDSKQFRVVCTSNATAARGFFRFSWTADSEL